MLIESYKDNIGLQHPFDVIIPTDMRNVKFVGIVVAFIRRNIVHANHIYIIANKSIFANIKHYVKDNRFTLLDEDSLEDNLSFNNVYKYLMAAGAESINQTGWYFQQFLKFAFALTPYCNGYYLSWDSDTLPISSLHFFQKGKPLFTMKKEYHRPYFDTMKRLMAMDKAVPMSFIAEHMIFKPEFVKEMISEIEISSAPGSNWVEKIVNSCDFSLPNGNFSEFETYGTFCTLRHPGFYGEQYLNTFRAGSAIQGRHITKGLIEKLTQDVDIASFELRDAPFPYNFDYIKYQWIRRLRRLKTISVIDGIKLICNRLNHEH